MKLFLLSCFVAFAAADVSHIVGKDESQAAIVKQELDVGADGAYQWSYETDNGISAQARGELPNPDAENPGQVAQGSARWTAPNGEKIVLEYIADENGFQPQGSHLPTAPPIPEAIQRSLEYLRAHPPRADKI